MRLCNKFHPDEWNIHHTTSSLHSLNESEVLISRQKAVATKRVVWISNVIPLTSFGFDFSSQTTPFLLVYAFPQLLRIFLLLFCHSFTLASLILPLFSFLRVPGDTDNPGASAILFGCTTLFHGRQLWN